MKIIFSILFVGLIFLTNSFPEPDSIFAKDERTAKLYQKMLKLREKRYRELQEIEMSHDEEPTSAPTSGPIASPTLEPEKDPRITVDPEIISTVPVSNATTHSKPKSNYIGKSNTAIAIINIVNTHQSNRNTLLVFNTLVRVTNRNPPLIISFFVKIFYPYRRSLRNLQEGGYYKNTPVQCHLKGDKDIENGVVPYDCSAPTDKEVTTAELNSEEAITADNEILNETSLTFSPEAAEVAKELTSSSKIDINNLPHYYELRNGKVRIEGQKFFINGEVDNKFNNGINDEFIFNFTDDNLGNIETKCKINSPAPNVEFECGPVGELHANTINLATGTLDKSTVIINLQNPQQRVDIDKNGYNNSYYRKTSSGLSGGAIAGIVIACAVALIIASVVAMMLRKSRPAENTSSSIVGLKTVDAY